MTGIKDYNFPTFMRYADLLRARGHVVANPADISLEMHGLEWKGELTERENQILASVPLETYLEKDNEAVDRSDAVAVLPGWEDSRGANAEVQRALSQGKLIYSAVLLASTMTDEQDALLDIDNNGEQIHPEGFATDDEYLGENVEEIIERVWPKTGQPIRDLDTGTEGFVFYESNPERHTSVQGGVKDNLNKPRLDLVPSLPLFKAGEVLAFGARKYKPHNWRLGLSWLETYGSLQRHLAAWLDGEDLDKESGYHHLAHAMCQMLFLAEFVFRETGTDDRFVSIDEEEVKA
jgi:hypothetical protein